MSNRAACNCGSKEIERSAVTQMKHSHLQQVVAWMQSFKRIGAVHRVSNNVIKIVFDRDDTLYFNMQRSHATIFTCNKEIARAKIFQAPFDVMLAKRFERSHIERITLHNNDKIMRIKVSQKGTYKASSSLLQLEFTGKYTNAIIMDDKGVVAEALRHIDESVSCRTVKVGERLEDPPLPNYVPKAYPLEDVRTFLDENYRKEQSKKLSALKQQKLNILQQRLDVLQRHYDALKSEVVLQNKAAEYRHIGHLIMANLHEIRPFALELTLQDYDGSTVSLTPAKAFPNANVMKEYYFKQAKKMLQRSKNLHIERENLESKITYVKHFIHTVRTAEDIESIALLFPEKAKQNKKTARDDRIETFFIEGYKVLLGKNEQGNIALLQQSKARDIWLHLKDRPSAHVIIVTDKQSVPQYVIEQAAALCVNFSVFEGGRYLVDYTPRREVKMQDGANVLYYHYNTISVTKS